MEQATLVIGGTLVSGAQTSSLLHPVRHLSSSYRKPNLTKKMERTPIKRIRCILKNLSSVTCALEHFYTKTKKVLQKLKEEVKMIMGRLVQDMIMTVNKILLNPTTLSH